MTRSKKVHINKECSKVTGNIPKTKNLIECNCLLHCGGSKLVDPRTFKRHQEEIGRFQAIASGSNSSRLKYNKNKPDNVVSSPDEGGKRRIRVVIENSSNDDKGNKYVRETKYINKLCMFHDDMILDDADGDGFSTDGNGSLTDDDDGSKASAEDDCNLSEDEIPIEQFISPDFDNLDYEPDNKYPDTTNYLYDSNTD